MKIIIPELSLVTIIGASGSGKSTFALKHFKKTEVLQSDYFRGLISDDENDQTATRDAFEVLRFIAVGRSQRLVGAEDDGVARVVGRGPAEIGSKGAVAAGGPG